MARGENELIRWLAERFPADPSRVSIGIGDDAAAVRLDRPLVVISADMLLDTVHFDTTRHRFDQIGRKAVACSLSDCAAMACHPRAATVSVALPENMAFEHVQQLADGMAGVAEEFGCSIVGGDTTSWAGRLAIDVAMLAEPMAERGPIRRCDARPGDRLYVSGPLGGSILGHHLSFTPKLHLASRLVREPELHAMMDISDGLALDLHRLCLASDCAAELNANQLEQIISDAARTIATKDDQSALDHALTDGEDFELLIAAGGALNCQKLDLIPVGRITPRCADVAGTMVIRHGDGTCEPLPPRGYEHFR